MNKITFTPRHWQKRANIFHASWPNMEQTATIMKKKREQMTSRTWYWKKRMSNCYITGLDWTKPKPNPTSDPNHSVLIGSLDASRRGDQMGRKDGWIWWWAKPLNDMKQALVNAKTLFSPLHHHRRDHIRQPNIKIPNRTWPHSRSVSTFFQATSCYTKKEQEMRHRNEKHSLCNFFLIIIMFEDNVQLYL